MAPLSLRARVLAGALLWTFGLFVITGVVTTQLMFRYPEVPWIVHHAFSYVTTLWVVALVCMILGLTQVRKGLSALTELRARLAAVHDGRHARVDGRYPAEVQPLVDDLNALLEHRERVVARALAKAGDLAHGLKTPLAVLSHEAERAGAAGQPDLASTLDQQIDRMRRQIEYHLAHARAAASGAAPGARCPVAPSADGLARTLLRLHAERGLAIDVDVAPGHAVRGQREDLDEMLGNLLDNACTWAKSSVSVRSSEGGPDIVIDVDDDGPGIEPSMREAVLERGVRADEAAAGTGLGLAIVRDLAELYGGSVSLEDSPLGGLRARLRLPSV
ncbi:MAG TPA: HAMP domain-containing sensor histidine kinase [Vicinamibacterales bacterium]|nr:HAMP domain-containing sensor histidine kinase [Vicinamibacterales bacterium]